MDNDNDDSVLQFTFNGSLVNKHFETILDIIGEKLKNKKQIEKNRNKILSLLGETFSNITAEKLENGFNMLYADMQDLPFKIDNIEGLNDSINRYARFILEINDKFKDRGYSMLVCGYFWLTKNSYLIK